MNLGIIRVLTTDDDGILGEHGRMLQSQYGIASFTRCIPDQATGIFDDVTEAHAIPEIITLGRQMQEAGAKALFLSCAADPGLAALRAAVAIPVISAGSAAARVAALLARPTAVMGIGDGAPAPFRRLLGEKVLYARPEGVTKTTDLLTPEGRRASLETARRLHAQGIQVIAFSCTGFSTIGLAQEIRTHIGAVAVDAVSAAGMFAVEMLGAAADAVLPQ
jgi:Asp/Glu/hydantoin racemase